MTTTLTQAGVSPDDYCIFGLATCFVREEGETKEVQVIEPIPSAYLETMIKGVETSYKFACAKTVGEVIPELKGRIDGFAIRVPSPSVSLVDFVADLERSVTVEEVNAALKAEADKSSYFAYSDEPLVSIDYVGNPYSSTADSLSTMVIEGSMVRVLAWYDNEWGYANRLVDLAALVSKSGL